MTTQAEVRREIDRRKSQTARLLEAFQQHGELTTKDLMRIGTGVSSRIFELRSEGYKIVSMREREGSYRYIYFGLIAEDDAL